MSKQIINSIKSLIELNDQEEKAFLNSIKIKQFKKKELLLKEGSICNELIFIKSGCLRVFYNMEGIENTTKFLVENNWYTEFDSFLTNKPTIKNIQALENCTIISLKKDNLYKLYNDYQVFERLGRIIMENILLSISEINKMLTNEEPEQRYLNFINSKPEVVERIPQHYIASFLRLKPQSLSRIKKRIKNK